jgi:ATP-dependent 26S proteasome regulatory subunit
VGESEKLVAKLLKMAPENPPSIIFINAIGSLSSQRAEGNKRASSRQVKMKLLV